MTTSNQDDLRLFALFERFVESQEAIARTQATLAECALRQAATSELLSKATSALAKDSKALTKTLQGL